MMVVKQAIVDSLCTYTATLLSNKLDVVTKMAMATSIHLQVEEIQRGQIDNSDIFFQTAFFVR